MEISVERGEGWGGLMGGWNDEWKIDAMVDEWRVDALIDEWRVEKIDALIDEWRVE